MGESGRVAACIRGACGAKSAFDGFDRQFDHPRASTRRGGKKGGPDNAIGRSRGGLSTKINAVVDERGLPVRLILSPGQQHDSRAAGALLADLRPGAVVIGDRAYDSNALLTLVADAGGQTCIPTPRYRKQQRVIDVELYRQRNLVERFFNKLKHFRRIATRYDKLASNFLAAVALAAIRLWTRNYESTT